MSWLLYYVILTVIFTVGMKNMRRARRRGLDKKPTRNQFNVGTTLVVVSFLVALIY